MLVDEISLGFDEKISYISCEGCNPIDVARALEAMAQQLRTMPNLPDWMEYAQGKIYAADPVERLMSCGDDPAICDACTDCTCFN